MNCDKFNECLDNYENLSDETKQKMDKHALECANCKSELEFMRSIISTAKSLPDINVPVDFMEKLNVRIDEEEKKKARITRRVMRNVRRNWKQYTAAAACFALVAVVTANSNMFVDKMNGNDDGVIQEETVVTDSDGNTAVSTTAPAVAAQDNAEENQPTGFEETVENTIPENKTAKSTSSLATAKPQTSVSTNSVKSSVVANNSKSTSAPSVSPKVQNNAVPSVSAEPAKSDEGAVSQKTTAEVADNSNDIQAYSQDDGIAIASIDVQSDDRSVYDGTDDNINNSRTVKSSVEDDYSLAGGAQIAYGRYYKLDKDGNPIEAPEENKPIGSIVISAKDADEALSVIRQYSYDEDGEFYTTSSDRLTSMLSVLSVQGIGYSNYTPAYEGEVTFKLVIS